VYHDKALYNFRLLYLLTLLLPQTKHAYCSQVPNPFFMLPCQVHLTKVITSQENHLEKFFVALRDGGCTCTLRTPSGYAYEIYAFESLGGWDVTSMIQDSMSVRFKGMLLCDMRDTTVCNQERKKKFNSISTSFCGLCS